ncbi:winged helix-turn-helix transcriptional regulator [Brucella pseudogrignonensis]|uniref:winged helix-turn-helix transcriptional regulator n=1 Tax=Brucella pseudogrignonensis TaxID=419475 RepID=UPI0038B44EC5
MGTTEKPRSQVLQPSGCGLATVLEAVSGKWALMAVGALCEGPLRFNTLRRTIGNVSQKTLTQTLRTLERNGLIHREVIATVPVTVIYSLTDLGAEFAATSQPLRHWSEKVELRILSSRASYRSEPDIS